MSINRIHHYTTNDKAPETFIDAWAAKCEQMVNDMNHDAAEVKAGRMTAEEFDAKW